MVLKATNSGAHAYNGLIQWKFKDCYLNPRAMFQDELTRHNLSSFDTLPPPPPPPPTHTHTRQKEKKEKQ